MMSIPPPSADLYVNCNSAPVLTVNTSGGNDVNSSIHPKLSPTVHHGSWKEEIEDLGKELSKICHSPGSTSPNSPRLSRSMNNFPGLRNNSPVFSETSMRSTNKHPLSPAVVSALAKRKSDMNVSSVPIPAVLVQNVDDGHIVLRVRHEETQDLLQKQLSMISGFKTSSQENVQKKQQSSGMREMASKVSKKVQEKMLRFRTLVSIEDCAHDDLVVFLDQRFITLNKVLESDNMQELRRVTIPDSVDINCLICNFHEDSLEILEYPKTLIKQELCGNSSGANSTPQHSDTENLCASKNELQSCITVAEDVKNNMWKLVWHIPKAFQNQDIAVKTHDEKLVITCKETSVKTGSVSPLTLIKPQQQQVENSNKKQLKITVGIPENVEPKTVSAVITKNKQLIIQGISSWRTRCLTY